MIGIRSAYLVAANIAVASSTALVTTTLTSPIAANKRQKLRWWIPFSVGAAGGIRLQIAVPAAGVTFLSSITLNNTVAPSQTIATQTASALFQNAAANAGTHWVLVEAYIENGATAGNVDLQVAQNTSDATPLTILKGAVLEVLSL